MEELPHPLQSILQRLTPAQQRLLACDCAEHVLPFFERLCPDDDRPRQAIAIARRYAIGSASREELDRARTAAGIAAWGAGEAAPMHERGEPPPEDAAAAPAAGTAEACCARDDAIAVQSVLNAAIEVVVTAAVGILAADDIWSQRDPIPADVRQRYDGAEAHERAWQLRRALDYANT